MALVAVVAVGLMATALAGTCEAAAPAHSQAAHRPNAYAAPALEC